MNIDNGDVRNYIVGKNNSWVEWKKINSWGKEVIAGWMIKKYSRV